MSDRFKEWIKFSLLRFRDMGDGTVAPVVSTSSVVMIEAVGGELFPRDCETSYEYDTSGLDIQRVVKTTVDGRIFAQDWQWDGPSLAHVGGWVRQN